MESKNPLNHGIDESCAELHFTWTCGQRGDETPAQQKAKRPANHSNKPPLQVFEHLESF